MCSSAFSAFVSVCCVHERVLCSMFRFLSQKATQVRGPATARSKMLTETLHTGRRSDKKPPRISEMLNFLSKNWAETPKFLKPTIEKIFRDGGGGAPPRGHASPPFQAEMVFSGAEGLDFQAKNFQIQPQRFSSISFLVDWPPVRHRLKKKPSNFCKICKMCENPSHF